MKPHAINEGKTQAPSRRKTPNSKIAPIVGLTLFFTIVHIYYPYIFFAIQKPTQEPFPLDEVLDIQTTPPHSHHPLYRSHLPQPDSPPSTAKESPTKHVPNLVMQEKKEKKKRKRKKRRHEVVVEESLEQMSGGGGGVVEKIENKGNDDKSCNLFAGEWVENPEGPYYTNTTCWAIQEHQNCMKFGRPDRGFLKWRWKPHDCELPIFDPVKFLEMVRGKSLAFVGDSVARNHMQSLICLLSRVTYPLDASNSSDENFKRWEYKDYDFNISIFWSPYLVKTERIDPNDITRPFKLYLDEFDESWTSQIENVDYVIISAGHWFFRPSMFYANRRIIGCLYCPENNILHRPSSFSYRRAWRTAFKAINSLKNFKGVVFLRTFAPSHFEGGPWDKGGDCARTRPFKSNETKMEDFSLEMYKIQMQEFKIGEMEGRRKGIKIRLMGMTQVMQLRPDGHPSKYGHWPIQNVTMANDCVHWCLPGPIDAWTDFLMEILKKENSG